MNCKLKNNVFSLTEVLLAVGVLSIGMVFIAGVFPVGIHLTTIAAERTTAAVVADEAFAKIKIYAIGDLFDGVDDINLGVLQENRLMDFNDTIFPAMTPDDSNEFAYPSTDTGVVPKQYYWSALFRRTGPDPSNLVQVTVFVCGKTNPNLLYRTVDGSNDSDRPIPVMVDVSQGSRTNELTITNPGEELFVNDGCTIVDDETGQIYRVLERYPSVSNNEILLYKP